MIHGMVSCIIPTYKRSDTLLRAVRSVLSQTYKNLEVIVIDDNEPNDEFSLATQEKLNTITDERIRYIQQEKHINGAVARNVGIRAASGQYIALLDDDDEWMPKKLEKQIAYMEECKAEGVSCYYELYRDGKLERRGPEFDDKNLMFDILSRRVQIMAGSSFVCKREAIVASGMFDETFLRHQDLQMLADFLTENKMVVLKECLVRIHVDSTKNQPSVKSMIEIKEKYLSCMDSRIKQLSKKEQKRVYAAHYFEIVVRAVKEKNLSIAFRYLLKIGISIQSYKDVLERYKNRK